MKKEKKDIAKKIKETSKYVETEYIRFDKGTREPGIAKYREDREIWEQQDAESDDDYALFETYLFTGFKLNGYKDLAEQTNMSINQIYTKSKRKKWKERIAAFREYKRDIIRERIKERIEDSTDGLIEEIGYLTKDIAKVLNKGIDLNKVKNPYNRTYALEKMVGMRDKLFTSLVQIVGGKLQISADADVSKSEGGIAITFRTAKPKESE